MAGTRTLRNESLARKGYGTSKKPSINMTYTYNSAQPMNSTQQFASAKWVGSTQMSQPQQQNSAITSNRLDP